MLGSARGFYSLSLTQLQLSFLSLRAGLARVAVGARGLGRAWRRVWRLALGLGLHLSCPGNFGLLFVLCLPEIKQNT